MCVREQCKTQAAREYTAHVVQHMRDPHRVENRVFVTSFLGLKFVRLSPLLRSAVFVPLLVLTSSLPWCFYAQEPVVPARFLTPFSKYFFERFVFRIPMAQRTYPEILRIFVDTPALRNLAIPPSKGGPVNQMAFVVVGWALLASFMFLCTPVVPIQVIGLTLSTSAAMGFILGQMLFDQRALFDLSFGVFWHIAASLAALLTVF